MISTLFALQLSSCRLSSPPDPCRVQGDQVSTLSGELFGSLLNIVGLGAIKIERRTEQRNELDTIQKDYELMSYRLCNDQRTGRLSNSEYLRQRRCLDEVLVSMRAMQGETQTLSTRGFRLSGGAPPPSSPPATALQEAQWGIEGKLSWARRALRCGRSLEVSEEALALSSTRESLPQPDPIADLRQQKVLLSAQGEALLQQQLSALRSNTAGTAKDALTGLSGTTPQGQSQLDSLAGVDGTAQGESQAGSALAGLSGASPSRLLFQQRNARKIRVRAWLICQRMTASGYQAIDDCNEATLKTNDRVKIAFDSDKAAHFYIVNYNDLGQYQMLYPAPEQSNQLAAGQRLVLPPGDQWLEADENSGSTEHLQLIGAGSPISLLEGQRGLDLPPKPSGGLRSQARQVRAFTEPMVTRGFRLSGPTLKLPTSAGAALASKGIERSGARVVIEFTIRH
ncbi:MAG: DUF4384 domain-containing protein [Myxococcota bacterium]|nr:DUF4384 domain-containing protein [Myxococcota bacterium]